MNRPVTTRAIRAGGMNVLLPDFRGQRFRAVPLIKDYPYLVAVAFFLASSVPFSQGAAARAPRGCGDDRQRHRGLLGALHQEHLPDDGLRPIP